MTSGDRDLNYIETDIFSRFWCNVIQTHYPYRRINVKVSDCTSESPEHVHNAVHLSAALVPLQRPVHAFLQLQWISSWQDFVASGSVVQRGCHPEASFVQPQSDGLGNSGFRKDQSVVPAGGLERCTPGVLLECCLRWGNVI